MMKLVALNMIFVDGKEVVVGSYEVSIDADNYVNVLECEDGYGHLRYEGGINETIDICLVSFKEVYRKNMYEKLSSFYGRTNKKVNIKAILN